MRMSLSAAEKSSRVRGSAGRREQARGETDRGRVGHKWKMTRTSHRKRVCDIQRHIILFVQNPMLTHGLGRKRELDRKMDAALKNPNRRRRRRDGIVSILL